MTPPPGRQSRKTAESSSPDATTFEDEIQALESILERLEAGELPLEQALQLYEEGVGRIRTAHALLTAAEGKLAELLPETEALLTSPTTEKKADATPAPSKRQAKKKKTQPRASAVVEEDAEDDRWPEEEASEPPFDPSFGLDDEEEL